MVKTPRALFTKISTKRIKFCGKMRTLSRFMLKGPEAHLVAEYTPAHESLRVCHPDYPTKSATLPGVRRSLNAHATLVRCASRLPYQRF
jgi:hypothetical protein